MANKVNLFRLLNADEIECRVNLVTARGVSLLLYKDARVDANILDDTVGPFNWKKEYSRDNQNCTVSIWDEDKKEWISKEDTGVESQTEKEKGLASDSFKRACFAWGLGRELYTAPSIWISTPTEEIQGTNPKKYKLAEYKVWKVSSIDYDDDRRISALSIIDVKTGEIVYQFDKSNATKPSEKKTSKSKAATSSMDVSQAMMYVFKTGVLAEHKGIELISDVKDKNKALNCLKTYAELDGDDGECARALLKALDSKSIMITERS